MKSNNKAKLCPDCGLSQSQHFFNWLDIFIEKTTPKFLPSKLEKRASSIVEGFFSLIRITRFVNNPDLDQLSIRSKLICQEAIKRGLKVSAQKGPFGYTGNIKLILPDGKRVSFFGLPLTNVGKSKISSITDNKEKVKKELEKSGLPYIPGRSFWFFQIRKALKYGNKIGYPLVAKPFGGSVSRHVTTNIINHDQLLTAIKKTLSFSPAFLVEKYLPDSFVYRATVIEKDRVFCVKQIPANITGNGKSTIQELVNQKNHDPKRNIGTKTESLFHQIILDQSTEKILEDKGYNQQTVLKKGEFLYLKKDPFLKLGGDLEEVTDKAHPDNLQLFKDVARHFDLELVGMDFIAIDIEISWEKQPCAILELNSLPCIDLHHFPNINPEKGEDVASVLLDKTLDFMKK